MATIIPYTFEKKEDKALYFTSFVKGMKVLIATEKPFAKAAVDGMVEILEGAGHTVVRLEKYTDKSQLLEAVAGGKNYWRASTGFGKGLTASATGSHNGPDGDGSGFFGLPRW